MCLGVFHIKWALFVTREGGAVSSVLTHPSEPLWEAVLRPPCRAAIRGAKYRFLGYLSHSGAGQHGG